MFWVSPASHEEVERLERLIVTDFKNEARGHKERLHQNHRVRKALEQMQERSSKLVRSLQHIYGAAATSDPCLACIASSWAIPTSI